MSSLQSSIAVANNRITGTLKYVSSGALANDWGAGNFIALKFTDIDEDATSVLVGLEPSEGSGLVELINDPDKNGVFKVTDKDTQKLVVFSRDDNGHGFIQRFDLSGLTLNTA